MKEHVHDEVSKLVNECCSRTRKRKIVEVFDELSNSLCRIADLAEFLRIAHPDQHFGHTAEDACIAVSTLVEQYLIVTCSYS
jgi:mitochondrial intermediate peptidase